MTGARGGVIELRDVGEAAAACRFGAVDEIEDDVGVGERGERGAAHGALERVLRIEQPGRVEQDHLHVAVGADADDAVAGGLRLGADDAELLADDAIEERGFSGVGFSGDGDDPGFGHCGS